MRASLPDAGRLHAAAAPGENAPQMTTGRGSMWIPAPSVRSLQRLCRSAASRLVLDPAHVYGAIAAPARIGLGIILDAVTLPDVIERYVLQRRAVEEEIFTALPLLYESEPTIGNARDCSLSH